MNGVQIMSDISYAIKGSKIVRPITVKFKPEDIVVNINTKRVAI